ncbi:UDP-3-O-acylglucosamine N-acyltransferase [Hondaea fermentalgiana]|uniref:UDP-3-O-acylglucosamine N-acyltransferase n=1 Tax=Hondaea fermentalgiana TaxID=2315210 RepID=A0A2R5GP88_9STRA|nr:UDP-3-O-acylglucosamine N-acyltransferase [Hondaea fermentalgiana]|eukprot:GBG32687.1 UDP-3-O-acylglucosamine N-acyltransferase [Hondaea fermentalgiana]
MSPSAAARVAASARVHATAALVPPVVVGARSVVGAHAVVGPDVDLGEDVHWARNEYSLDDTCSANCAIDRGSWRDTEIGPGTKLDNLAGIAQHLKIGNGAQIAAKSGVMADVEENAKVGGLPAVPIRQFHRQSILLRKLAASARDDAKEI